MRKISAIVATALLLCLPASARKTQKAKLSNAGTAYIESSFGIYDAMQKEIHALAELGYLEYKSSELLATHLESHGFSVERGVAGIPTAFVAKYGSGKALDDWRRENIRTLWHTRRQSRRVPPVMDAVTISLVQVLLLAQSLFQSGWPRDIRVR